MNTYVVYRVDERVVARVTHSEPVEAEEYYVDVSVPENILYNVKRLYINLKTLPKPNLTHPYLFLKYT